MRNASMGKTAVPVSTPQTAPSGRRRSSCSMAARRVAGVVPLTTTTGVRMRFPLTYIGLFHRHANCFASTPRTMLPRDVAVLARCAKWPF